MLENGSVASGTWMTTLNDLNSLITLFGGGFIGAVRGSEEGRVDFTVFAQDLTGFDGSGWCKRDLFGKFMVDDGPSRLNISLNSLTDSINASIMSNTAG